MIGRIRSARLGMFLNMGIGIVFIIAAVIVVIAVNYNMRRQALIEAQAKARIILDRNLATHTYFSQIMKPSIFTWSEPFRSKEYFDHTWMSSTYAIREIEKYFKSLNPSGYSFKDAAIDARSPENEADEYERVFLEKLAMDKKLESDITVRKIDGKPYLVVLRKGEVMEASCLRCHSTPQNAPKGLTDHYGSERSFNRKAGDAVSAVSLRIPLAEAYAGANVFSLKLSAILIIVLACLFTIQYWLYKRYLFQPLNVIRNKANEISTHEGHLGEQIPQPFGRELGELTATFNEMSVKLRHDRDHLEELVDQRTEALQESEIRYRELVENMGSGVSVYETRNNGADFIFKEYNAAAEMLDKTPRGQAIGRSVVDVFPGVKDFGLFDVFQRVYRTGKSERHPVTFYKDEKISGWRENYVYKLPSGEIVAVFEDVTERKRAEEALKKSETLHREAQAAAHIGHWELDTSIMTPAWSEEIFHIFGLDPEGGEPSFEAHQKVTHPDDGGILNNAVTRSIAEGIPFDIEFRILLPDKTIRWLHAIGYPKKDSEGRIISVFGTAQDITDSKLMEETLEASEENFRRSLEESPLGVRIVAEDGETIYSNRAFLDIYGYDSIEEFKTTSLEKRYTPESHAEFQIRREKRKRGADVPSEYDISIVKKDDEVRHLQVFRKEILWDGERQFQVIYQDITERKRMEEEKHHLEERSRKVVEDIFRFIPEGVLVFSRKMELLRQNQAFRDLVTGYAGRLGFAEDELENLIIDKVKAGLRDNNIKEIKIARKHETGKET